MPYGSQICFIEFNPSDFAIEKNYCPAEFTMLVLKICDFPLITVKIIMS
jgi:hypothetical protein